MPSGSENRDAKKSGAKSAKAMKAAKKSSGGAKTRSGMPKRREIPWMTIGAVVAVLALVGLLAFSLVPKYQDKAAADKFAPSAENPDPSTVIDGVVKKDYPAALHVAATQRVAYDQSPPFGGPHDATWATCTGIVYPTAIRTENAVHSLEHGAVWIAYNPDKVSSDDLDTLKTKVDGKAYMLMSPYPGLDSPISLQSWGHQLKVDSADDKRINEFVAALRLNNFGAYPEKGASCSTIPGAFDPDNPPAFDPTAPGPDAVTMDGTGITPDTGELGGLEGLTPPAAPAAPAPAPAAPAPAPAPAGSNG
ncbi:DUF3105 domain-containing protein [Rhodococcus tukisamuensis]|uniref:DUF3105 domain-containing protein n=1 Tax=Rhodococcus tukisamuensis TaxID=168276 RepID=A0A1G7D8H8_9NOCA|nr:DUF3105 domain-containing protein [Rhodococcus tukisamuensis]SDE47944.1 Protein of unknown function [Rhodococcus tukisamuensis]